MQDFIDAVTNEKWSFDDDVIVENILGVYSFKTCENVPLKVPATLVPDIKTEEKLE